MPLVAGSGWGSDGSQMLLRSPTRPLWPAEHRPNRLPMSPIPGTEHAPPAVSRLGESRLGESRLGESRLGDETAVVVTLAGWIAAAAGAWCPPAAGRTAAAAAVAGPPSTVMSRPSTS